MTLPEMNEASSLDGASVTVETAAISDRGLSEKRPVNEDSFLADAVRGIFVVADGVGGAQSGEVASQTAVETLDEAFRHHKSGEDAEDLMEIAFQRANLAIHQMSREHHKLAMMATTVVALHLDGTRATFGHVGDSRLYRLAPDGQLRRETIDHSVVEEEVRAGRLTADEALIHPSRNVISRALGAEPNVEAEMGTTTIEANTIFLLCSDGITRHVPDDELQQLLTTEANLHRVCDELKRRCYERGAEDNLTAVLARVTHKGVSYQTTRLDEQTLAHAGATTRAAYATGDLHKAFDHFHAATPARADDDQTGDILDLPPNDEPAPHAPIAATTPLKAATTRLEVSTEVAPQNSGATQNKPHVSAPARASAASQRRGWMLPVLLLLALGVGGALAFGFYANRLPGMSQTRTGAPVIEQAAPPLIPQPTPTNDAASSLPPTYTEQRAAVDEAPQIMMNKMWRERDGVPLEASDPQFLYLYGRALFKMGNDREAQTAFRRSIEVMREQSARGARRLDSVKLNAAEAELSSPDAPNLQRASDVLDEMMQEANAAPSPQDATQQTQPASPAVAN